MIIVTIALLSLIVMLVIFLVVKRKEYESFYENVVFQLDQMLADKPLEISPYLNSRHSAVASRLEELKRKMNHKVDKERIAREKVHMFISDLSHQIKTPLTNVIMYNEILVKKLGLNNDLKEMQQKLTLQLNKLEWILESLFKAVYLEEEYLNFDMDYQYITQTISVAVSSVFKKADDKSINIYVDEYKDLPVLHNMKWTAEALVNILENGIKYSPENSNITIKINHGEFFTEISTTDEGMGIDSNEYQNIFKRFYRSKDIANISGSGIGLYLVKTIIEKQKGYVVVHSEKEKGTMFSVFLQNFKN